MLYRRFTYGHFDYWPKKEVLTKWLKATKTGAYLHSGNFTVGSKTRVDGLDRWGLHGAPVKGQRQMRENGNEVQTKSEEYSR